MKRLIKELKNTFRPEFLNRIDETIIFEALSNENLIEIAKIQLGKLIKRMEDQNIKLEIQDTAVNRISKESFEPEYGARPIKRLIRRDILSEVSKYMLRNPNTDSIHLDYDKKLVIRN